MAKWQYTSRNQLVSNGERIEGKFRNDRNIMDVIQPMADEGWELADIVNITYDGSLKGMEFIFRKPA